MCTRYIARQILSIDWRTDYIAWRIGYILRRIGYSGCRDRAFLGLSSGCGVFKIMAQGSRP